MSDLILAMKKAIVISCSRCKTEGLFYGVDPDEAEQWFYGQGWRFVVPKDRAKRLFCPDCMRDITP